MFNLLFITLLLARFLDLGLKPPHHDETINGWFVQQMWQTGSFTYDPSNYHGPLLFYLFQMAEAVGGWGVESFRFVTVMFSVLTLIWFLRWTERRFSLSGWWALGLALSPGFLFFSRSGIHESAFVFFTVMAATSWIDVWFLSRPRQMIPFLYGLTGVLLLKETFVIPFGLAVILTFPILLDRKRWQPLRPLKNVIAMHFVICLMIWVLLYSSFLQHPKGLLDFFRAFFKWGETGAANQGHAKNFDYFWRLIGLYEPATTVALLLCFYGVFKKGWVRWVSVWAIGILTAYSAIRYKTPWCLISMQLPIWIAGVFVISQSGLWIKRFAPLTLAAAGLFSLWSFYDLNFKNPTQTHPYVYVQTAASAKVFADSLIEQAKKNPEIRASKVQWATQESWPFPWWLQTFKNQSSRAFKQGIIGDVDLLLVDVENASLAEMALTGEFWKGEFLVRDAREPAVAFLRKSLFACPFSSCQEVVK